MLSIIIPVYNVEPYLQQCMSSVLACRLDDCEILLSLGQSSDRSNLISEEYEKHYGNIHTVRQRGTGLSDARNSAMEFARGKYVLYIDSDDYVDSEVLDAVIERLRSPAFSADVIVTDFRRLEWAAGQIVDVFQIGADTPERRGIEHLPDMLRKRQYFWNVWRYVYRRGFLTEHEITFQNNMLTEDVGYTTDVLLAEPDIVFMHAPYYVYVAGRGGSLMDTPTLKRLTDTVWMLCDAIRRLKESTFSWAPAVIAQFQFEYLLNLALTVEIPLEDRKPALALYQDWWAVLSGSADPLVRIMKIVLRICGLRAVALALHMLKILRRRLRPRLRKRRENA